MLDLRAMLLRLFHIASSAPAEELFLPRCGVELPLLRCVALPCFTQTPLRSLPPTRHSSVLSQKNHFGALPPFFGGQKGRNCRNALMDECQLTCTHVPVAAHACSCRTSTRGVSTRKIKYAHTLVPRIFGSPAAADGHTSATQAGVRHPPPACGFNDPTEWIPSHRLSTIVLSF